MSVDRMKLSMNRRRLLWWGRLLPLLAILIMVCTVQGSIVLENIFGVGVIPLWLGIPPLLFSMFLIMFSPFLILFAHHPFEELPKDASKIARSIAKLCWLFFYVSWFVIVLSYLIAELPFVSGLIQSTIDGLDFFVDPKTASRTEYWYSPIITTWNIREVAYIVWFLGIGLATILYEYLTGWKMFRFWTLRFPPEEYPPISKRERIYMEKRGMVNAS